MEAVCARSATAGQMLAAVVKMLHETHSMRLGRAQSAVPIELLLSVVTKCFTVDDAKLKEG